ncbi:hypothetical protein Tco_0948881, partial [Tanacetum coccineum]
SDSVMSDSDESGITYTAVSSPFEDLSDIGSPRADDHEYLELPYIPEDPYLEAALQAPPSPDYVPGPEEPEQAPLSPDYVPGPEHADDEIVAEDQPGAEDASPAAQSPDYVPDTDPEADPEEDDDEDPEEDPIDYPADGGDDGDDEMDIEEDEDDDMDIDADEEDEDDEMDVEVDEEAEEEHSAPAYPVVVALPATVPSAEETEPFETDESAATPPPHPAYRMTARITIPEPLPVPAWSDSEVARLLAISSPPASPLSPWSSSPPQIPFSQYPTLSSILILYNYHHPSLLFLPPRPDAPPPMPTSAPTSITTHYCYPLPVLGEERPEVNPHLGKEERIRRGHKSYVGFGITIHGIRLFETFRAAPVSTDTELGAHSEEIFVYGLGGHRFRDPYDVRRLGDLWMRCDLDALQRFVETDRGRREEIRELRAADRTRQQQIIQTLTVMQTLQREMIPLQGLVNHMRGTVDSFTGTSDGMTGAEMENGVLPHKQMKKMTDKYCPRNEMKKLETELWNLKVIGTDVVKYNQRFQELATSVCEDVLEESDKLKGLSVDCRHDPWKHIASKPMTMQRGY